MGAIESKYVIIGGGIAGTTAAETIRQNDSSGRIIIVSDEPYRLYSRAMLSKPDFFVGKIPFEKIFLKNLEWYEKNRIEFLGKKSMIGLNPKEQVVKLDDGGEIRYEKLLLAIGGKSRIWNVQGADKSGIFYMRTLDDGRAIIEAAKKAKSAVAVGGGAINFEMCEMLRLAGLDVALIIRGPYLWRNLFDEPAGLLIEEYLKRGGVKILKNDEVVEILGKDKVEGVKTKNGQIVACQLISVGIGVCVPLDPLKESGIQTSRGILVNEYLETNFPNIFAAGDAAEYQDVIFSEKVQSSNWLNARAQGKIAGLNMVGKREVFKSVSFSSTQGFGLNIGFVGDPCFAPGMISVSREQKKEPKSYARIILKNGKIRGAALIDRPSEAPIISKLIFNQVDVSEKIEELKNPDFDLKEIMTGA